MDATQPEPRRDCISVQLGLPGIERTSPQTEFRSAQHPRRNPHMLFFAVQSPPCAARCIVDLGHRLKNSCQLANTPFDAHRLHISLHSLGDHLQFPQQLVSVVCEPTATIAVPRFTATFESALTFCGRSMARDRFPFVLAAGNDITGFLELKTALGRMLGIRGRSSFTPHITLLYDRKIVRPFAIEPISWTVNELVLIHALVKQPNRPKPSYSIVGRWQLY